MKKKVIKQSIVMSLLIGAVASAEVKANDPLGSVAWDEMHRVYLNSEPVVFDDHVQVSAPDAAEDSTAVPVMVEVKNLDNIERIIVLTDLNPIAKVLEFEPVDMAPRIGFRIKVQQATPVRAAARTTDGIWHVGGVWLDATGGGCTVPSATSANANWASRLGNMDGRLWPRESGQRLRLRIQHPMDTGLAPGIPAFYIEDLLITDSNGKKLGSVKPYEPVSENPTFSFDLATNEPVHIAVRDNNGNEFDGLARQQ